MVLSDILFNQFVITLIYIVLITTVLMAIASFTQIKPETYRPFMYFIIAVIILNSFLEKKSGLKLKSN